MFFLKELGLSFIRTTLTWFTVTGLIFTALYLFSQLRGNPSWNQQ